MARVAYRAGENENVLNEYTVDASLQDEEGGHDEYGIQYQSVRHQSSKDNQAREEHGEVT